MTPRKDEGASQTLAEQERAQRQAAAQAHAERWVHPDEVLARDAEAALLEKLADVLTPVFAFIAKGRLTNTMDVRSWVVLYETRPDLIGDEKLEAYAKRRGVSAVAVYKIVKEFRASLPTYRSSNQRSETTKARMSAAARERADAAGASPTLPPPPGKESFLP